MAEYRFNVKHIRGKNNNMADYLSRSPVDMAREDTDEMVNTESKCTQTDASSQSTDDRPHRIHLTAAITRTQARKHQKTGELSPGEPSREEPNELIPHGKVANNKEPAEQLLGEDPHRIIAFDMEDLKQCQENDEVARDLMRNIAKHEQYTIENGLLLRRQRPPLPTVPFVPEGRIRADILKIYHDTPGNGAHFGRDKTTSKIQERYYWPTMVADIRNHVNSCLPCAQNNLRRQKPPGTLKPIPPPEGIWKLLSMDFHGPIVPTSRKGNRYIISLTDVLSKFVIAKAVKDCTATTAVNFLINEVILKYGTPTCILTDNGSHFTAQLMTNLFQQLGATHLYSTVYHPQTNGQIERFNATMDGKIAALCNERRTNWDEILPFVTFNYNTAIHATTRITPFELMHGRKATLPFDQQDAIISLTQDPVHVQKLNAYVDELADTARSNITKSQQQYKTRYDSNRQDLQLKLNDLVLVKTRHARNKFDLRHEGPFRVVKQIGRKTFIVQHTKKTTLSKQVTMDVIVPLVERWRLTK